ncbi:MAG: PKD domain-containing protein [Bacteroidia bacterium]|nr:PKD domain-containing protein [Bacteroidia bacterium]
MNIKTLSVIFLTAILIICCFVKSYSQISYGGQPLSYTIKGLPATFDVRFLQPPDPFALKAEDDERAQKDVLYRYGVGIETDFTLDNSGTWNDLPDGDRLWRLKISAKGAMGLGIYYDNFFLPKGAKLFIYNEDNTQLLGSYTEDNNPASGLFANELVQGETATLEYYEPAAVRRQSIISINEICYAYRAVNFLFKNTNTLEYNSSKSCEVDVNCSESANWQNQKRSVVRIGVKDGSSYGWCSGSLVNNSAGDCLPYILTANHCSDGYTTGDLLQWVFYFNYERTGCNITTEAEPVPVTITGSSLKANGPWTGSDFFLVLLNKYVPTSVNPYFNGWRSTNTASPSGTGIHHPAGDVKKISTYTTTLANYGNTHWNVVWSPTTHGDGVTEPGSSGSPIFNNEGLVVGTLSGGLSACTAGGAGSGSGPDKADFYGKFSYSWASNGSTASSRLKDWLAPDGSNPATLQGKNEDCTNFPPIADFYPSLATAPGGTNIKFNNTSVTSSEAGTTTTYQWNFQGASGTLTSVVTSPSRVFEIAGTYPVTLTANSSNGLSSSKTEYVTITSTNGIIDPDKADISIYPNPANDYVNIDFRNSMHDNTIVRVYNSLGQEVYSNFKPHLQSVMQINMSMLPSGIYYFDIIAGSMVINRQISLIR